MYREDSLDADTVGNSANGEGLGNARTLAGNNGSFKSLNSFSLALADLNGNLYGVADLDLGDLSSPVLSESCAITLSASILYSSVDFQTFVTN